MSEVYNLLESLGRSNLTLVCFTPLTRGFGFGNIMWLIQSLLKNATDKDRNTKFQTFEHKCLPQSSTPIISHHRDQCSSELVGSAHYHRIPHRKMEPSRFKIGFCGVQEPYWEGGCRSSAKVPKPGSYLSRPLETSHPDQAIWQAILVSYSCNLLPLNL